MIKEKTLNKVLAAYSIHFEDIQSIDPLYSGINKVYHIVTHSQKFVLKEFLKLSQEEIEKRQRLMLSISQTGVKIPATVQNIHGTKLTIIDGRKFELSEYIEHIDLSDQVTISRENIQLVARNLGIIHKKINIPEIRNFVDKQDFARIAQGSINAIEEFVHSYKAIGLKADEAARHKIDLLYEIVCKTQECRKRDAHDFKFLRLPFHPTHGDYSMVNVLVTPDGKSVYTIDWDNLKLRPHIWDLQAAMSLFSLTSFGNAYVIEPAMDRLELFLKSYLAENPLPKEQLLLLPEVIEYNFSIYWLSYTIPPLFKGDFRLLDLIPEDAESAFYWTEHVKDYKNYINTLVSNY